MFILALTTKARLFVCGHFPAVLLLNGHFQELIFVCVVCVLFCEQILRIIFVEFVAIFEDFASI